MLTAFPAARIYECRKQYSTCTKETKIKRNDNRKGETKMNTNMKELTLEEIEQVNAGSVVGIAACVVGIATAAVKVADFVYDCVKSK